MYQSDIDTDELVCIQSKFNSVKMNINPYRGTSAISL